MSMPLKQVAKDMKSMDQDPKQPVRNSIPSGPTQSQATILVKFVTIFSMLLFSNNLVERKQKTQALLSKYYPHPIDQPYC